MGVWTRVWLLGLCAYGGTHAGVEDERSGSG